MSWRWKFRELSAGSPVRRMAGRDNRSSLIPHLRAGVATVLLISVTQLFHGCSSSKSVPRYRAGSGGAEESAPEESLPYTGAVFDYKISNGHCDCLEYRTRDYEAPVEYSFRAEYSMQSGFVTEITVDIRNGSADTLTLDPGSVMVSSRNIEYQYNNKFIPLPDLVINPGASEKLTLDGKEVTESPDWNRIAGEQLTLTLRGMRLGGRILTDQVITFVPENPLLGDPD